MAALDALEPQPSLTSLRAAKGSLVREDAGTEGDRTLNSKPLRENFLGKVRAYKYLQE